MLVPSLAGTGLILAVWCSWVELSDFVTLVTTSPPEGSPTPSIPCMLTRCGYETFACLTDRQCLKALACLVPCGSDQACTFHCISNYETDTFHNLNRCNIQEQHCIELASLPESEDDCGGEGETTALASLPLSSLTGIWYIVLGLNPIYDCFPCQVFSFGLDKQGNDRVVMDYQVEREEGDIVSKRVVEFIEQKNKNEEGVLSLSGIQNGLMHEEEWRVVAENTGNGWLVASYCGAMTSWRYRGLVVLARVGGVTDQMEQWVDSLGFNTTQLCKPKSQGCILQPIDD